MAEQKRKTHLEHEKSIPEEEKGTIDEPEKTSSQGDSEAGDNAVAQDQRAKEVVIGELKDQLESLKRENEELVSLAKRVQADFENFKKRARKQNEELEDLAKIELISKLLPVLEVLDLAKDHDEEPQDAKGFVKALEILDEILKKEGLEKIGLVGEVFDPKKHEAISHVQGEDEVFEAPVVLEVHRYGYSFKDKILRPAIVTVKG